MILYPTHNIPSNVYYIFDGKYVKEVTRKEWQEYLKNRDHILKKQKLGNKVISTIFIGLVKDIFETNVYVDGEMEKNVRYGTYEDALKGHEKEYKEVLENIKRNN